MIDKLNKICKIYEDVDMFDYNTYRLHSKSKCIVFPYNLEEFGNTGGASIPGLMVTRLREQLQQDQSHRLLCSSFGLGLSWGTMLLNVKNVVIPELVEI